MGSCAARNVDWAYIRILQVLTELCSRTGNRATEYASLPKGSLDTTLRFWVCTSIQPNSSRDNANMLSCAVPQSPHRMCPMLVLYGSCHINRGMPGNFLTQCLLGAPRKPEFFSVCTSVQPRSSDKPPMPP